MSDTYNGARWRSGGLRKLASALYRRRFGDEARRAQARYDLLDQVRHYVMPEYTLTEFGKSWWEDANYFSTYRRLDGDQTQAADRRFFLRELLKLVEGLEGDTAEAGTFRGTSSWFICDARKPASSTHWAFDSFEGLSAPGEADGRYWRGGDLRTGAEIAARVLEDFDARVFQGWIPAVFGQAEIEKLVFAHIDVDLYEPTLASLEFFYPLTVSGGLIVCDDYGFTTCPGARQAFDEFMVSRPERIIHCPTGQGFIIKQ